MATKAIKHALSVTTDETTLIHTMIKAAIAFKEGNEESINHMIEDIKRISPSVNALHNFRRRVSQILHGNPHAGWGKGSDMAAEDEENETSQAA